MASASLSQQGSGTEHVDSSGTQRRVQGYDMYSKLEILLAEHHEVLWHRLEDWLNCHITNHGRLENTLTSWGNEDADDDDGDDDIPRGVVLPERNDMVRQECVDKNTQRHPVFSCLPTTEEPYAHIVGKVCNSPKLSGARVARNNFVSFRKKSRDALAATVSSASDDAARAADRVTGKTFSWGSQGTKKKNSRSQSDVEVLYKDIDRKVVESVSKSFSVIGPRSREGTSRTWTHRLIESNTFDCLVMFLVVTNCIYIGIQLEYMSHNTVNNLSHQFDLIGTTYWAAFLTELILRISVYGKGFFISRNSMGWNYLDTFLVVTSSMEVALTYGFTYDQSMESDESAIGNLYIMRLIRLLRLARIFRVLRVLKFFRQFRVFIKSIAGTLKSLVLALSLLGMIIYTFATIFTNAYIEVAAPSPEFEHFFGSLSRTTYSLFLCITGGVNWGDVVAPLAESTPWAYSVLFLCYISFIYFAVLNVMTGVFCQNAIETAEQDDDTVILELLEQKQDITKKLQSIFHLSLLYDEEAEFTAEQFVERLHDEELKAWFASIDIEVSDAWTLFKLLDGDRTGSCNLTEFVEGCLYLRGSARQLAIAELSQEMKWIIKRLSAMSYMVEDMTYILHGCDETWEPPRISRSVNL